MKVLVIGAYGRLGQSLVKTLQSKLSSDQIFCADIKYPPGQMQANFIHLDATHLPSLKLILEKNRITHLYCLAHQSNSLLNQNCSLPPDHANLRILETTLLGCRKSPHIQRIFWPSSHTATASETYFHHPDEPEKWELSMDGLLKKRGELWCQHYVEQQGMDIRCIRYPVLIEDEDGAQKLKGNIDYEVWEEKQEQNSGIPLMPLDEAVEKTIQLMEKPKEKVKSWLTKNISCVNYKAKEIEEMQIFHLQKNRTSTPSFKSRWVTSYFPSSVASIIQNIFNKNS